MKEMKELINKLNQYSYEYYTLGKPTISDTTYDGLYDKLIKLEEETGVVLSNSPTQNVGNVTLSKLEKTTHEYPMLSLDKTKSIDTLNNFRKNKDTILMLKMDGLTIDLVYDEKGNLIEGSTRGDAFIGENITHTVKTFSNIPLKINNNFNKTIHIIGEAIIDYDTFDNINSKLSDNDKYKNPRNLVSGTVRQLNSKVCKDRNVKFVGYIVEGLNIPSKLYQLKLIKELGFETVEYQIILSNNEKEYLESKIDYLRELASNKKLPIDGMVLMYNNIKYGKSLGNTAHHPLHSIAFKFENDVEFTKLINVEFNVSRTGRVNPIALFNPVELYGTTVTRATLNNLSILKSLQLGLGDEIGVTKANEIIPMITDNLTKSNTLVIPEVCPVCGEPLIIKNDTNSEFLYCQNPNCKAKLVQSIFNYCNRDAMNIVGLSEKSIEKFIEKGFIKSILDIYSLDKYKKEIIHMEGFGLKSYNKLIDSIEKSKQCKLENFIYALGIPNVGLQTAKNIVKFVEGDVRTKLNTLLMFCENIKWLKMNDCGESLKNSLIQYFNNEENNKLVFELSNLLSFIEDNPKKNNNVSLEGKTFVITGKVHIYKNRNEIKDIIESLGGKVSGSVSSKTDYLINNDINSNSGKNKTAKELNIPIISEEQFVELIK